VLCLWEMRVSRRRGLHNPILLPLFVHCICVCPAEDLGSVEAEAGVAAVVVDVLDADAGGSLFHSIKSMGFSYYEYPSRHR
jgi:hypothetical protein